MSLKARRQIAAGITGCLVAAFVMAGATGASAGVVGPYNIDGNIDTGITAIADPDLSTKELGPINSNTTKIGVIHSAPTPKLGLTNPNAQVDLNTAWLDARRVAAQDYLYFAWQRDSNSGSGFISFEFMKLAAPVACAYDTATQADLIANCNPWANRRAGDFLILWDQQGNSTTLYVRIWSGTFPNLTLGPATELPAGTYQALFGGGGFRGEAAINLTAAGLTTGTACVSFANVIPSTVTGNSDTADTRTPSSSGSRSATARPPR